MEGQDVGSGLGLGLGGYKARRAFGGNLRFLRYGGAIYNEDLCTLLLIFTMLMVQGTRFLCGEALLYVTFITQGECSELYKF